MRIMVVSLTFHPICILNSNRLWAPRLPKSVSSVSSVSICVYLCQYLCHPYLTMTSIHNSFMAFQSSLTTKLVNMAKGC